MGATVSQSVDAAVTDSLSITNSQTQDCITQGSQSAAISVCQPEGCRHTDVIIRNVDITQTAIYTTECQENIDITTDIQQEISQQFSQAAEAIAQQFQASQASVDQASSVAAGIGDAITNTTVQRCVQRVAQDASINITCQGSSGEESQPADTCTVLIDNSNISQGFTPYNNCLIRETQVQAIVNQVKQIISQTGRAKVESILGPLITLLVIILVFIGFLLFGGAKALTSWKFWLIIIVIIVVYLGLAYWRNWFPFQGDFR